MAEIKNLEDLFEHELNDLLSAEEQLTDALPKMAKKAKSADLKKAFNDHLKETKKQLTRVKDAFKKTKLEKSGETCKAMEGLIKEAESIMKDTKENDPVMDAALIAAAQKVEHYEISSYGTAVTHASKLGFKDVADLLKETLKEEKDADAKLNKLAKS